MKIPVSVLVLSIIGIALSAIGILGLIWSIIIIFFSFGPPNPMLDALRHDTFYIVYSAFSYVIGILLIFLLLVASIASLRLRKWARRGMLIYGWTATVECALGTIFTFTYILPKMFAALPASASHSFRAAATGGLVASICEAILGFVFPICILYFFSRPHVIDVFNGIFPHPPTPFPVILADQPPPDSSSLR